MAGIEPRLSIKGNQKKAQQITALYIPSEYLHAVTIYVIFEKQGPCPRHDTRARNVKKSQEICILIVVVVEISYFYYAHLHNSPLLSTSSQWPQPTVLSILFNFFRVGDGKGRAFQLARFREEIEFPLARWRVIYSLYGLVVFYYQRLCAQAWALERLSVTL